MHMYAYVWFTVGPPEFCFEINDHMIEFRFWSVFEEFIKLLINCPIFRFWSTFICSIWTKSRFLNRSIVDRKRNSIISHDSCDHLFQRQIRYAYDAYDMRHMVISSKFWIGPKIGPRVVTPVTDRLRHRHMWLRHLVSVQQTYDWMQRNLQYLHFVFYNVTSQIESRSFNR